MKLIETLGATSRIWQIFIADSSSTTGAGLTGLVFNSSGLTCYYHRDTDTTATAVTLVTMTVGTFTSSGFKEIDATNMPGWYQLCPPNAVLASGAKSVGLLLKGATNMAPLPIEVQLVAFDTQDAVRMGLTALPNANAAASGGLPTIGATIPNATAGASGGLLISGSNSGTTTLAALTITGAMSINGTGNVAQTGDSFTRLGAPVAASISADIAGVQSDTDNIQTRLPAALVSGRMDVSVGAYQSGLTPLQPTVAGRTLDVSVGGEAGIDLANVGSPTTTLNLSGTTISTSQAVASVSGAVGSVTADVGITQTGADKVWSTATRSLTDKANFTLNVAYDAAKTAAQAGDPMTLEVDAVDATALATSAVTEIADGLLNRDMSTGTDSGTNAVRTVRQALRVLRNKVDIPNGIVYKEDDSTSSWTFATTTAAGNPVTVVDPANA